MKGRTTYLAVLIAVFLASIIALSVKWNTLTYGWTQFLGMVSFAAMMSIFIVFLPDGSKPDDVY